EVATRSDAVCGREPWRMSYQTATSPVTGSITATKSATESLLRGDEGGCRAGVEDDVAEDLLEVAGRLPPDRPADLPDRRLAVEHVLDPLTVDLAVRHRDQRRRRAGHRQHPLREVVDRDALRRSDVEDLTRDAGCVHQVGERADRVLHVTEAARLRAVAVDLERPSGECVRDEARDHHPVLPALPGTDRVEEPHDDAVEPALLVVSQCEELVERLRLRVRPAPRRRRAVHALALLRERLWLTPVAVDFRRRRDEHALAESVAVV